MAEECPGKRGRLSLLRGKLFSCGAVVEVIEAAVGEFVEGTDPGDSALVADDDDFGASLNRRSIFAAGCGGAASAGLRKDNFANAAVVADAVTDLPDDAGHLGIFGGEDALVGKEEFEQDHPEEAGAGEAAENGQDEDERSEEATVAVE